MSAVKRPFLHMANRDFHGNMWIFFTILFACLGLRQFVKEKSTVKKEKGKLNAGYYNTPRSKFTTRWSSSCRQPISSLRCYLS